MTERLRQGERVGTGAMAEVYRGVLAGERGVQKPVAIKRLRRDLRDDPRAIELFVNEARIAVQLTHPNVVQGLDFARDERGYYLVYEWLDCVTLAEIRERNGPLPWRVLIYIGRTLCDALSHVHQLTDVHGTALDIVHRDVTPGNVFVTANGLIKLGDFGVATSRRNSSVIEVREVGTPGFAAPEQAQGTWDARSDVFGVGATLAALAEELPEPVAAVLTQAANPDPAARYENAGALDAALAEAATRCGENGPFDDAALRRIVEGLDQKPETSSPQLDGALQSILGGALAGPPTAAPATPSRTKTARPAVLAGLAAVLAFSVVVTFFATQGETTSRRSGSDGSAPGGDVALKLGIPKKARRPNQAAAPNATGKTDPAIGASGSPADAEPELVEDSVPPPRPTVIISLNSVPWAHVQIDGKTAGNTPLRKVKVTVGRHQLSLLHPPEKMRRTFTIHVTQRPGQAFLFDLRRGTVTKRTITSQ